MLKYKNKKLKIFSLHNQTNGTWNLLPYNQWIS